LLAACALCAGSPSSILFLMADQLRYDYVTPEFTPNLYKLSQRGLSLSNTYSSTPTCTPARSALVTGLSPWYHGMLGYSDIPKAWPFMMPAELSLRNYSTCSVGKNHYYNENYMNSSSTPPPSHGWQEEYLYDGLGDGLGAQEFDTYDQWFRAVSSGQDPLKSGGLDWNSWRGAAYEYPEAWHPSAWVARTARSWLTNHTTGPSAAQPFFLKVSFHRPHSPYDPPPRVLNATPAAQLPPQYVGAPWDARFAGPSPWCGPASADAWCGAMPPQAVELTRRAYLASVKFMDESLGTVLDHLAALGLENSTWVLFIADHGDGQGEHNLWRKSFPYELSTHVPGIVAWPPSAPGVLARAGSTTPLLAEVRDIFATALDLAGANIGELQRVNGTSWACLVERDPSGATCGPSGGAWRQHLDLEHNLIFNETNHWSAIVSARGGGAGGVLKYIFSALEGAEQLFNLTADPHEMQDVAAAQPSDLAELRALMGAQFLREGRGPAWVSPQGLPLPRPAQAFSPHFPAEPSPTPSPCPPPPPIASDCPSWFSTQGTGGYYRSCGGPSGNLKAFSGYTVAQAQAWCCTNHLCAGFDFDGKGSGFFKTNALGGWSNSSLYFGVYKVGQVPGH
jgi:arylsulfatase